MFIVDILSRLSVMKVTAACLVTKTSFPSTLGCFEVISTDYDNALVLIGS